MESYENSVLEEMLENEYICDKWSAEYNTSEMEDIIDNQLFNDVDLIFREIKLAINN